MRRTNDSCVRIPGRGGIAACAWLSACLFFLFGMAAPSARALGVHASMVPDTVVAATGDTVNLEIDVTEAGDPFNGYDAVVGYDPAALTFLQVAPLYLQEGSYMKGACGNTFHYFQAAPDSLTISHVILCAGVALTGPGQLYRLRFRVKDVSQGTWVRIRSIQFYNAGYYVNPAYSHDAYIANSVPAGVPPPTMPAGLSLGTAPNPCRSGTVFSVGSDRGGEQSLAVYDITGRAVRTLERGSFAPGIRRVAWDARDSTGERVPPGVYQVVFRAPVRQVCTRVAVIP